MWNYLYVIKHAIQGRKSRIHGCKQLSVIVRRYWQITVKTYYNNSANDKIEVCTDVNAYVCTDTCIYIYTYIYIYIYIHTYIHTYIHIYIHIYMHMYTDKRTHTFTCTYK